eukprot:Gb_00885 [translate_table: standard]
MNPCIHTTGQLALTVKYLIAIPKNNSRIPNVILKICFSRQVLNCLQFKYPKTNNKDKN